MNFSLYKISKANKTQSIVYNSSIQFESKSYRCYRFILPGNSKTPSNMKANVEGPLMVGFGSFLQNN